MRVIGDLGAFEGYEGFCCAALGGGWLGVDVWGALVGGLEGKGREG